MVIAPDSLPSKLCSLNTVPFFRSTTGGSTATQDHKWRTHPKLYRSRFYIHNRQRIYDSLYHTRHSRWPSHKYEFRMRHSVQCSFATWWYSQCCVLIFGCLHAGKQERVTGSCVSSAINSINSDGTVECLDDQIIPSLMTETASNTDRLRMCQTSWSYPFILLVVNVLTLSVFESSSLDSLPCRCSTCLFVIYLVGVVVELLNLWREPDTDKNCHSRGEQLCVCTQMFFETTSALGIVYCSFVLDMSLVIFTRVVQKSVSQTWYCLGRARNTWWSKYECVRRVHRHHPPSKNHVLLFKRTHSFALLYHGNAGNTTDSWQILTDSRCSS